MNRQLLLVLGYYRRIYRLIFGAFTSENIATSVLSTWCPLVRSVHVHSMNTFLVACVIFECSPIVVAPLMIGGSHSYWRLTGDLLATYR